MRSRKIYFAVFGSGLGHVARVLDLTERLRGDGYEFRYSSSDQALNYLNTNGKEKNVMRSPSLDVEWTKDGGFSSRDFLPRFRFMFNAFLKQVAFEEGSITQFNPRLVVSDSRLSAVLAARIKSYPVITMLNQFKVNLPPRFQGRVGRVYERIGGNVLGLLWSLSDLVLMTDLPPPYTIGEANLLGTDVSNIVRFVGFTSPKLELSEERLLKAKRSLDIDDRPIVFCQISGPDATKERFKDIVLQAAQQISQKYNFVISMGYTGGSTEPKRLADGTWLYDWCPIRDELFILSEVLVSRAGHRTIGQCIDAGKPAVLIPIRNHSEQLGNADKFHRLGLGIAIKPEGLSAEKLVESVEYCLTDSKYKSNVESVRTISKRYDGIERCAEIIDSFA
jgi:UDP:flavonoid glycosyltransferase YjiC (YdhE family)